MIGLGQESQPLETFSGSVDLEHDLLCLLVTMMLLDVI